MKNTFHGLSNSTEYHRWANIKFRCYNPDCVSYKNYGARGITMHPEWKESFLTFYNYLLETIGLCPGPEYTIERINNDGNYQPGNLKWAKLFEQARNRRSNKYVQYRKKLWLLCDLALEYNISQKLLRTRLRQGMTVAAALKKINFKTDKPLKDY